MNAVPPSPAGLARPSRLWLWVAAAFALQCGAWAAWLTIAARHPVQSVPLAQSARTPAAPSTSLP